MNFSYPAAFALNTYAVTALLIFCGLTGKMALAADIGIAQSATLALFYAFSANVRNLVLRSSDGGIARAALLSRLGLLLPLSLLAYYLSAGLGSAAALAAAAVILRRGCEWLSEVQLSAGEYAGDARLARNYVLQQGALLGLLPLAIALLPAAAPYALFVWAVSPLPLAAGFIRKTLAAPASGAFPWGEFTPNFGSTAIIGIAAYIFRLILLQLAGREAAGDLYTAFAIGALSSSLYAGVFGPTVLLGERRGQKPAFARWLTWAAGLQLAAGAALFAVYAWGWTWFEATGKSLFFAGAAGASLAGGVLMLQAQKIRLRLLQAEGVNDLFGPDVLMNVAIIGSALLGYALAGEKVFLYLYLWNSALALLFYLGAKAEAYGEASATGGGSRLAAFNFTVALLLVAPVFFQPGHGLFVDPTRQPYFDTLGVFKDLPLPAAILGCFAGAAVFGACRGALYSLLTIFSVFTLMFVSVIFSAGGAISGSMQKIMLMVQFILPFLGLVVGQAAAPGGAQKLYRKVFLGTVFAVSSAQLLFTFLQHTERLTPYLYAFSVYQHLQYVPVILAAVYVTGLFSLYGERAWRPLLLVMAVTMPLYSVLAASMGGLGLSLLGPLVFAAVSRREARKPLAALAALGVAAAGLAFYQLAGSEALRDKFTFLKPEFASLSLREKLPNLDDRLRYWKVYSGAIAADGRTALWGHQAPPPRAQFPSAHNYALDFVYNFGLLPFLPLLALLAYTLRGLWRRRGELRSDHDLLGLALAVLFLVLVDNSLKVGLRQPYPGILTFFLWGALLTRLREIPALPPDVVPGPADLRLAILNLTGGGISGGYKKYLVRLLPLFEKKLPALRALCAAPASVAAPDWFAGLRRTEFAECRPFSPLFGARDPGLRGRLDGFSPDVVFAPLERYFSYPGKPFISMLVNMAPMASNYEAGSLSEKFRHLVQRYHAKKAMVKSDHIIVTSKFVRGFLTSEWKIPAAKISVIYPGADPAEGQLARPAALAEKGWDKFFWTIGSLERYRGLEDILGAMQLPGAQDANLVVCASARPQMEGYARELRGEIERKGLGPRVRWVKGLSEGELAWCYANAEAFIMTSRIEAGPNTALEALAAGAVTIAAQNPPLPEFFGDTALYYLPGHAAALAARIAELRAWSGGRREAASAAAFERSKQFSWEYAADRTLELFGRLARRA
ncbi:MAG: glycosyltransferase [Elusimicrobiales bacterium]|nr:glycosyltransferase [Elusimicrobiales bacterium]